MEGHPFLKGENIAQTVIADRPLLRQARDNIVLRVDIHQVIVNVVGNQDLAIRGDKCRVGLHDWLHGDFKYSFPRGGCSFTGFMRGSRLGEFWCLCRLGTRCQY